MSDMAALPQFELPRSDDQKHTEQCKAKHQESNAENTQTAAHASSPRNCSGVNSDGVFEVDPHDGRGLLWNTVESI